MSVFIRLRAVVLVSACLCVAVAPARAQFFFPFFFDNRPTPPRAAPRPAHPPAHRDVRPHSEKTGKSKIGPANAKAKGKPVAPKPSDAPAAEGPPPVYEPQLERLSEIMGALAYLQTICAAPGVQGAEETPWRERMENLMSAENAGPNRRERLAGAYNRGLQGYRYSYRTCTPNAELARRRYLDEGARLAHDIAAKYRAN